MIASSNAKSGRSTPMPPAARRYVGYVASVCLAPHAPLARVQIEPHVPALPAGVGEDPADLTASLRRAAGAGLVQPIGQRVAAIVTWSTADLLGPTWSGVAMTSPSPRRSVPR